MSSPPYAPRPSPCSAAFPQPRGIDAAPRPTKPSPFVVRPTSSPATRCITKASSENATSLEDLNALLLAPCRRRTHRPPTRRGSAERSHTAASRGQALVRTRRDPRLRPDPLQPAFRVESRPQVRAVRQELG